MGVKHVEAFDDSLLVTQQVVGVFQCFDGSLNALAHQASSSQSNYGKFGFLEKSDVPVFDQCAVQQYVLLNQV
jgi:hypothetical protein